MAREKSTMEMRDILTRLKLGHGIKQIYRDTGTHRKVIRKLRKIALKKGWLAPESGLPDEKELYEAYYGAKGKGFGHPLDRFRAELENYADDELSYVVMHQLIRERVSCSESTVRRYVQTRIESARVKEIVRRRRDLAVMEVDFGRLGIVYDLCRRRNRLAYVFSARLRFSSKAYRDVVYDQKQETFWECHVRAFDHFAGVPQRVVPDNLKAAVVKASFSDPVVNRGYRELAEHYGFLIDPCLPYRPQHKGGVEGDIKYVKKNFFAAFRMRQRQRGRDVPYAQDILPALREWERTIADTRIIKGVGVSPDDLFAQESPSLRPLPPERFDIILWSAGTVRRDGRVYFDRSRYSVPDRYIGKNVLIASDSRRIRVFCDHELIAAHGRSPQPHQDIVNPDHLGPRARAYLEHTRENLLERARGIGDAAHEISRLLLDERPVAKERSVRGIITLAGKYGKGRVDAACRRALAFDAPRYDAVKRILDNKLDILDESHPADSHGQRLFTFAREAGYFDTQSPMEEQS
jgi:hypothetical protein